MTVLPNLVVSAASASTSHYFDLKAGGGCHVPGSRVGSSGI